MEVYILSRKRPNKNVIHPDSVEGVNSIVTQDYRNLLYRYIKSVVSFENLPDTWNQNYIKNWIFKNGYLCMVEWLGNTYCLNGGYSGRDFNDMPTRIIIANPVLKNFSRRIGENGELLYINWTGFNFESLERTVNRYAVKLASCDASINVSLINSRASMVFECENDADKGTIEKAYDEITNGEPAVFVIKGNSEISSNRFNAINVKQTYIANDVQLTKQSILNEFFTEIGIPNANTDKRERLNTDEVNANNGATESLMKSYVDCMNECLERFNKIAGTSVKCVFKGGLDGTES